MFPLNKIISDEAIHYCLLRLEISGQNPFTKYKYYSLFINICWAISVFFCTPFIIMEIFGGTDDITNIADSASNFFIELSAIYKIINLLTKKTKIQQNLKELNDLRSTEVFHLKWRQEMDILCIRMVKICHLIGHCYVISSLYYILRPFFLENIVLPVPLLMTTALDTIPGLFTILYVLESFAILLISILMSGHDVLIFACIYYAVIELKMLRKALEDLIKLGKSENEIAGQLKLYVHHHNKILKFISNMNAIFSLFFLYQFLVTSFGICLSMFIISINISPFKFDTVLKFLLQTLCVYLQLTLYCSIGSKLTDESEAVGQAIYQSQWTSAFHPQIRRMMLTIIHRSQKAAKLEAAGMVDMNLISLTKAVRTTFSYFTLIRTIFNDEHAN